MKPKISPLARTSLLAIMIGLGPVAIGQIGGSRTDTGNQRGAATTTTDANYQGTQDKNRAGMQQHHAAKPGKRLGDFKGRDIHNRQGEKLGTIDDVVIDTRSGDASHVIVNHGGMLGIGRRSRAIPMGAIDYQHTANDGEKRLVLDITSARWNQAPAFDRNRLNDLSLRDQTDRLNQFYGYTPQDRSVTARGTQAGLNHADNMHHSTPGMNPADRGQTGQVGQTGQTLADGSRSNVNQTSATDQNRAATGTGAGVGATGTTAGTSTDAMQDQTRQLALASDIKGKTVRNGNQDVGSIKDIVIHVDQGKASALIDPSNDMVEGDDKFLVPFSRIDHAGDKRYTTTVTRQDFERARTGAVGTTTGAGSLDRIERWSEDDRSTGSNRRS